MALLNLLQSCGWSNSLEDLAISLQAADDTNPFVVRNVNLLLCKMAETFAFAEDYKLQDFAHRHELKFVMNYGPGCCAHLPPSSVKHRCIQLSLQVSHNSGGVVTAQQLNKNLAALVQCHLPEQSCKNCNVKIRRRGSFSIQEGCDPDFITVVCKSPLSFSATDFNITFSNSVYRVMTVVNWDSLKRQASVSREKPDGWWFHGVEEGQAQSHKYTDTQVKENRHLQEVSVLFGVRVGAIREQDEHDQDHQEEDMQDDANIQVQAGGNNEAVDEFNGQRLGTQEGFQPPLTSTQLGPREREVRGRTDISVEASVERTTQASSSQTLAGGDGNVAENMLQKDMPTSQTEKPTDSVCKVCGFRGIIADHLRLSKDCVNSLRKEPQLKMKASELVFIVKASLMLTAADPAQCPAKECPGGPHSALPQSCLVWWRETGWTLMGWSGSATSATSEIVHQKISQFRKNLRRRNKGTADLTASFQEGSQVEQQSHTDHSGGFSCEFCPYQGSLVNHLLSRDACLIAHLRRDLPHRVNKYTGRPKLAVFDLGIMRKFCSNPDCEGDLEREGVNRHVGGGCLQFYQTLGQQLLNWGDNQSASSIEAKMKNRRTTLKALLRDEADIKVYQNELGQMLKFNCSSCLIQGPLLNSRHHVIHGAGSSSSGSQPLWQCSQCSSTDDAHQNLVTQAVNKVRVLGSPGEYDDTLKKMVVEVGDQGTRVVFVPAALLPDYEETDIGDNLNPITTTVLVPKNPEALEQIGDDASERANQRKKSLEEVAEHFGRRHFFGALTETLSVLHQYKLGIIRIERLAMLGNMKRFRKGKIISRDPNQAEITGRSPHYAETQKYCLTDTCSFSPAASEKRSQESFARAAINGQVKLKVEITLLKNLARDSPILRDIILSCPSNAPLISHAPTVLNYLKVKVKLLLKHIIAPIYSNWDLDLRFAVDEWTVTLVGFLHCEDFDGLNQKIARGELTRREIAREILQHHEIMPTTALTAKRLEEEYGFSAERAKVKICTINNQGSNFDMRVSIHIHIFTNYIAQRIWSFFL